MPRLLASSARAKRSALPPPERGLKNSTGRFGAGASGNVTRTTSAARAAASDASSPATTTSCASSDPPVRSSPTAPASATAATVIPATRATPRRNTPYQADTPATTTRASRNRPRGNSLTAIAAARTSVAAPVTSATTAAVRARLIGSCPHQRRPSTRRPRWIEDAERLDLAIYAAVARTPTPALDVAMSRLSRTADYSRLSLACAALLAVAGGRTGRRAAVLGLGSLGVTATVVNAAVKPLARRRRPDRLAGDVPAARHVTMPNSRSFPSGHSAGAFAFQQASATCPRERPCRCARSPRRSLLARAHRRALPRRRAGGRADRYRAGTGHHTRDRVCRHHEGAAIARIG